MIDETGPASRQRTMDSTGKFAVGLAVLIVAGQVYPDAVDAWVPIQRSAEAGVLIGLVFGVPALIALLLNAHGAGRRLRKERSATTLRNDLTSRWPATVTAGVLWWALGLYLVLMTAYGGRSSETRADARAWDQTYPRLTVNAVITLAVCAALFVGVHLGGRLRDSRRSARRYTR